MRRFDFSSFKLSERTRQEIENGFQNIDPRKLEECEKILTFRPETQKLIRELMRRSECNELNDAIAKMLYYAKINDTLTDSMPFEKRDKIEGKLRKSIKKIELLLNQVSKDAWGAYALSRNYFYRVGDEFNLHPEVLEKLRRDLWTGIATTFVLGFGIIKLVQYREERKKLEAYKQLCEEMLEKGFIN